MNTRDALLTAVKAGDIMQLKTLLVDPSLVHTKDDRGFSLMNWAALEGKTDVVQFLHAMGATIDDIQNDNKSTPLHCAASKGHIDTMHKLIELGADPNAINVWGTTPLFIAVISEQPAAAKFLIERSVKLNIPDAEGETLLCAAVNFEDKDTISLLSQLVDVNEPSKDGSLPLHKALETDDIDIVKLLLDAKADIEIKNSKHQTPLVVAINMKRPKLVQLLLERGAAVNVVNEKLETPLHLAVSLGLVNTVNFLLDKKPNLEAKNIAQETALHIAVRMRNLKLVQLLLSKGADVNATNDKLETPLHLAVASGDIDILNLIISAKPNINAQNKLGATALHSASHSATMTALLLKANADWHVLNNKNRTALHHAVMLNETESIKLLSPLQPELVCEDFKVRRELSIVVNHEKLNLLLQQSNPMDYESGFSDEFYRLVEPQLAQFISLNRNILGKELDACLERCKKHMNFSHRTAAELVKEFSKETVLTLTKGFQNHGIPFFIEKLPDDNFKLVMIDRGALAVRVPPHNNKAYTARILSPIPAAQLLDVLSLICEAYTASQKEAETIFFDKIPALSPGLKFKFDDQMIQQPFKRGQCYFENHKSLLLYEFIAAYGETKGTLLYKEFDLFLHQQMLNTFIKHFEPSKDKGAFHDIIKLCSNIIELKKARLLHRAIKAKDEALVKRLISQHVSLDMGTESKEKKESNKLSHAMNTAIFHGNDTILFLLEAYQSHCTSINEANKIAFNKGFKITNEKLQKLEKKAPDRHRPLKSKWLIDNQQLALAQENDPVFFDHYFIKGCLKSLPYVSAFNNKISLADPIFLHSQSIENLYDLAECYAKGVRIPKDLLTAESLLLHALRKTATAKYGIDPPKEIIEKLLKQIQEEWHQEINQQQKKNDPYFNKWDNKKNVQQNIIAIFEDYASWSLVSWKNANTKEIKSLAESLKCNSLSNEELRWHLMDKRFLFLKSGVDANNNLIRLLNFAIKQLDLAPKQALDFSLHRVNNQ